MNELINSGIYILGERDEVPRPIVIVGSARSGTSMIAGALSALGVFMGDLAGAPVFEDVKLSKAFESGNSLLIKDIIADYRSRHSIWGWKRPGSINYLPLVDQFFESPCYVFIFKDLLSIGLRNQISMKANLLSNMLKVNKEINLALEFLSSGEHCAMLVSYDKALNEPKKFVEALISFYRIKPDVDQIANAVSFIRKDSLDYLLSTRSSNFKGHLDSVGTNSVCGWAFNPNSKHPVIVNIYVNDINVGKSIANLPREDLKNIFDVDCQFNFTLPKGLTFKSNDIVRVRIAGDVVDLHGSPMSAPIDA